MDERLRAVSAGLFIGLITLVFGIVWAIYIATQHERIHEILGKSLKPASVSSKVIPDETYGTGVAFAHERQLKGHGETMEMGGMGEMEMEKPSGLSMHEDPAIEISHERLTRGHIHWMGLGTLAIVVSILLAFLNANVRLKAAASLVTSIGGLLYPVNWIIMGFRTPSMGPELAEQSVTLTAGPSIGLVLLGILMTIYCLITGLAKKVSNS